MRCREARRLLEDRAGDALPVSAREHVRNCLACQVYERDGGVLRSGFRALSQESVPEASAGFVDRLMRRLAQTSLPRRAAGQFWELVGRRVVLAGSLLAVTVLLALVLLPSGPLRSPVGLDLSLLQVEAAENDPVLSEDIAGSSSGTRNALGAEDRRGR